VRIVLDTNVVVSGLLWSASPRHLLDAVRAGRASAFTSRELLEELADVLSRPHLVPLLTKQQTSAAALVQGYALLATIVTSAEISATIIADPDDDALIATALAARADLIISGDRKVLDLKHHHGIAIVNPAEAQRLLST